MAEIFDRETLLDLTVNMIPLGIILFFTGLFVFANPFAGLDRLGYLLMLGLHLMPFVGLAILTYVSGKAIAGDEKRSAVFFQGQAAMDNAPTREEARASYDRHISQDEREDEPPEESVAGDESETAEQEAEPAHHGVDDPEATAEPAPPKDVDETGEAGDGESDAEPTKTLDEQADGVIDDDESATEKAERAEGTVADESEEAVDDEPVAGTDERDAGESDDGSADDDRAQ